MNLYGKTKDIGHIRCKNGKLLKETVRFVNTYLPQQLAFELACLLFSCSHACQAATGMIYLLRGHIIKGVYIDEI